MAALVELFQWTLEEPPPPGSVGLIAEPTDPYNAVLFTRNLRAQFGVSLADYTGGGWKRFIHPEDRHIGESAEAIEHGSAIRYRFRYGPDPDSGPWVWLTNRTRQFCVHGEDCPEALIGWIHNGGPVE